MQRSEAIILLGVQEPLCDEDIRRAYRKAALKHHPDKGGSSAEFHRIGEAHDVLHAELGTSRRAETDYSKLMNDFLRTALGGHGESILSSLVNMVSGCKAALSSFVSLRDMNPQTCLSTLRFLEKHADLLHIDPDAIHAVRMGLHQHQEGRPRFSYTLNATLDHMLTPDVYKLVHQKEELLVPLWHEDLMFDVSGGIVCVRCAPTLPPHVSLDSDNHIHVDITTSPTAILSHGGLDVQLGNKDPIRVQGHQIRLQPEQTIRYQGIGVPLINLKDVYDTEKRGDVLIHLKLSIAST